MMKSKKCYLIPQDSIPQRRSAIEEYSGEGKARMNNISSMPRGDGIQAYKFEPDINEVANECVFFIKDGGEFEIFGEERSIEKCKSHLERIFRRN